MFFSCVRVFLKHAFVSTGLRHIASWERRGESQAWLKTGKHGNVMDTIWRTKLGI